MPIRKTLSCLRCLAATAAVVLLAGAAYVYLGLYPIGADVPHNAATYWLLETVRERAVARAARDISVPGDLEASARLLSGGADYNDMCAGCHLRPGENQSDFSLGLYPAPPDLTEAHDTHGDPASRDRRRFWIIKHGIKASGMPAWGPGHDDERIWSMVAFLDRLPDLTPQQYQIITARSTGSQH
ncbi:MAG: cytochrome C oxidase Cbb3 [Gammaproteobacteria bacterium]|nr:cytochrome C oxidase Cbb3 [Porticoccaceae bacterium]MBK79946.1 cytochrome C oxidase Cbb3 [Gammaproteobacteria bacterium]